MELFIEGIMMALAPHNILYLFLGCIVGLVVGVLPGLGPIFGVALFLPLTFNLPVDTSLILLTAIYGATAYGDGITSILLKVPGGPSGLAITFDGYPLTQQGKAGMALGALAGSALLGDLVGIFSLAAIAPPLSALAMKIGPAEYFMLTMFGLSMVSMIGKGQGQAIKGFILACFGLLLSFFGRDVITGAMRFTFNVPYLEDGIQFIPACIGLFAVSQAITLAEQGSSIAGDHALIDKPWKGILSTIKHWYVTLRSSIVGVLMSCIPGIGITVASLMSYMVEERVSKEKGSYGKGNIRGVIAPQAAASATNGGELIPAFSLGIPSGPCSAIFIAALTLHGLQPGLMFFTTAGKAAYSLYAGMFLSAIVFFILGITCTPLFSRVSKIPASILVPTIVVLSFTGSFAIRNMVGDLVITAIFGVVGYFLFKYNWPVPSLVLGLILGELAESNFHRALMISDGSYGIFVSSPLALGLLLVILAMIAWTYIIAPLRERSKIKKAV